MRVSLSYKMMTGTFERELAGEAEIIAALRQLEGTGAGDVRLDVVADDRALARSKSFLKGQPEKTNHHRSIDPSTQSISIADARRPDCPLIYVNRGFEHLTGYTRDECRGLNCRILQGPQTDRASVERIRLAARSGEPLIVDLLNYRKDGSTFWNRLSLKPVKNSGGELTHIIGIQSDITPMLQLQDMAEEWAIELGAITRGGPGRARGQAA
jgi:PAS domain S-box-containing protein